MDEHAMIAYVDRFPDSHGTRSMEVMPGCPFLYPGKFHFLEYYCNDPDCDCRQVLIVVCEAEDTSKILATICWGFDRAEYYRQWMADEESAEWMVAGHLDPDMPQSKWAHDCLAVVRSMAATGGDGWDTGVEKHYRQFKASLERRPSDASPSAPPCLLDLRVRGETSRED